MEDEQVVYDQVANPGFSEKFEGKEAINISAADAGAVEVEVNGHNLEPLVRAGWILLAPSRLNPRASD